MKTLKCEHCGAPLGATDSRTYKCPYCGTEQVNENYVEKQAPRPSFTQNVGSTYTPPQNQVPTSYGQTQPAERSSDKLIAGLLALFLGSFGVHHFYLGKIGKGILYALLSWTGIPAILGFIQGILILTMSDASFRSKYNR